MTIALLKSRVRNIGAQYKTRSERTRRLFIEERAASLHFDREREYSIKGEIAKFFDVSYSHVCFCGSGQLGFSIKKDKLFEPSSSDLDAACIDIDLYQKAWINVMETTRAFTDLTPFGVISTEKNILEFKDQILRRGMIRIEAMPSSPLKTKWTQFEGVLSRKHTDFFKKITVAIYMNEYAFCWKQDSALNKIMRD